MKSISILIYTFSLLTLATSCSEDNIVASGDIITKNYDFSDYTSLEVSDNFNVSVSFSDTEENIEVEANSNLYSYIKLTKVDTKLIIKLEGVGNIIGNETLNVYITTKQISNFNLNGNSKLDFENQLNTDELMINLSGNSFFTGTINCDQTRLISKGNCMTNLSGNVNFLDAKLSGNCEFSDYSLKIVYLKADLSGNSNAYLTVSDAITIDASSNSNLFYKGNASIIHQDLSSDSNVIKKD